MSSNVDYTICPECFALNAAMWQQNGLQSYDVSCSCCGYEYERGRFASDGVRLLVHTEKPLLDGDDPTDKLVGMGRWKSETNDPRSLLALTPEDIEQILADEFGAVYGRDYWEEI